MNDDERPTIIDMIIVVKAILELAETIKRETMHGREALSTATIETLWSLILPPPKPPGSEPVKAQKTDEG